MVLYVTIEKYIQKPGLEVRSWMLNEVMLHQPLGYSMSSVLEEDAILR